jgi:hypothetical protein
MNCICRIFLSQYHEKDMERIQQKLKQKEEDMARREEKRIQELEKVRMENFEVKGKLIEEVEE